MTQAAQYPEPAVLFLVPWSTAVAAIAQLKWESAQGDRNQCFWDALRMVLLSEGVTSSEEQTWERLKNEVIEEALTLCEGHSMLPEAQH
eukprot:1415796-Amphidinium_carterae.1